MENPTTEPKQLIDLETIPKLITAIYFMAAAYAVVKLHLHYEFFLHVSIFQYLDITEILLFAASTGVTWLIYLGGIILGGYILNDPSTKFNVFQKIIFGSFVYGCVIGYMYLAYQFDPIIKQTISLSWSLKWWTLLPLTLIIIAWIYPDVNGPVFF